MPVNLTFPINTERLVLRPHRTEDATSLHAIYSQPEVARYLLDDPWTAEQAVEKVGQRLPKTGLTTDAHALALIVEYNESVIGDVLIWFTDIERKIAEIGWVLDPAYGGQGLAAEAAKKILDLAFDTYGCHRVVAQMDGRNIASAKLAERIGMTREGYFRQDWYSKGEWTDTCIYAMLASDRY